MKRYTIRTVDTIGHKTHSQLKSLIGTPDLEIYTKLPMNTKTNKHRQ